MLHYAVVCFVVAVLAAMFGFSGVPIVATEIARVMFFMCFALFLVTSAVAVVQRRH